MTNQRRLQNLRETKIARDRYYSALNVFEELHIFDILRERLAENCFSVGTTEDTTRFHKMCGYVDCINDIQTLLEYATPQELSLDFGARQALAEEGYSEEEINKMLENE